MEREFDRTEDVARGVQLVRSLREVMPEQADTTILAIYDDIRATLRVPLVNFIFRLLANYPTFLTHRWTGLAPHLRTVGFERLADDLRAKALLEPIPRVADVDWGSKGDLDTIRTFTDTTHYVVPKLLLVATTWDEALLARTPLGTSPGSIEGSSFAIDRAAWTTPIPSGIAEGTGSAPMVSPHAGTDRVRGLFTTLAEEHGHPGVATFYRVLANWPEFLEAAWDQIQALVDTARYHERKHDLIERARQLAEQSPLAEAGPFRDWESCADDVADVRGILAVFRYRIMPDLLVQVTLIKSILDGPEAARVSRFSVGGRAP